MIGETNSKKTMTIRRSISELKRSEPIVLRVAVHEGFSPTSFFRLLQEKVLSPFVHDAPRVVAIHFDVSCYYPSMLELNDLFAMLIFNGTVVDKKSGLVLAIPSEYTYHIFVECSLAPIEDDNLKVFADSTTFLQALPILKYFSQPLDSIALEEIEPDSRWNLIGSMFVKSRNLRGVSDRQGINRFLQDQDYSNFPVPTNVLQRDAFATLFSSKLVDVALDSAYVKRDRKKLIFDCIRCECVALTTLSDIDLLSTREKLPQCFSYAIKSSDGTTEVHLVEFFTTENKEFDALPRMTRLVYQHEVSPIGRIHFILKTILAGVIG